MIKFSVSVRAMSAALMIASLSAAAPVLAQQAAQGPARSTARVAGTSFSIDELYRYKSLVGLDPQGYS
ncbi:hypothetical protein GY661_25375, partial [Escherichia coli]|nr:hypothetical protein [Escherichia coli]